MWVFSVVRDYRPWTQGDLDPELAEALLGGSELLSNFLMQLTVNAELPMPAALTCNICDRQIQPWFFEKHTALCIVSHKSESEVQDCHDHLRDHRQIVTDLLKSLEKGNVPAQFNGLQISTPPLSPVPKTLGILQHNSSKAKTGKNRRTQIRTVELILDYCDLAIDISTPAIPEDDGSDVFIRIQSPDSRNRIAQLHDWTKPSIDDPAMDALYEETHVMVVAKLNAVTRLHNTIHYSEKIRQEIDLRVQELIDITAEDARISTESENLVNDIADQLSNTDLGVPFEPSSRPAISRTSSFTSDLSRERVRTSSGMIDDQENEISSHEPTNISPSKSFLSVPDISLEHEFRASSPLSQFPPVQSGDSGSKIPASTSVAPSRMLSVSDPCDSEVPLFGPNPRRNSPHDLEAQILEARVSRGIYESPRRPSGGSRPPTGYSPSRRGSRAVSRNRAANLVSDRGSSPSRKTLSARMSLFDKDHLSPSASPTLSATESSSTDTSFRDRRTSAAPPLSPRLPSIAPAARPAPPSIKDFDIIKPISKGAFGSVYLSKKRTTGDYYAIKVLKKADMIAKNQVTNIKAERAIMMAQTESPFIAKLFFTFQSKEYLYLVMEYLNGGDCAALIKQLGGLPEDWTRRYMAEVVLGLEYLHSRGIIHRDLKPDNLLISHNGHLKLTDFGLSRVGLVGRQNRARTSSHPEAPDLLSSSASHHGQNRFSPNSSRSASFDFVQSGLSTPAIAPVSLSDNRSGYFNLRDRKTSHSEASEGTRSELETFSSAMSKLNLDDNKYESDDAASTASGHSSAGAVQRRPPSESLSHSPSTPSSAAQMPPPAMKLFDPQTGHKKFVGTPDYLAPETINGSGQDDMVDWWSLGVILFEFSYGYPPFHAQSPDAVFENILNRRIDWPSLDEEVDLGVSNSAKDLMEQLMTMQPSQRLGSQEGAADIKAHCFFDGIVWNKISEEEALFVPTPDDPEDTDYFDTRGATNHVFEDDSDTQRSAEISPSSSDKEIRSSLSRDVSFSSKMVNHSRNMIKRTMMPLSIPPHVRDRRHRNRRLSESGKDEFGSFTFKNLGVLEKQNLEALRRLRNEQSMTSPVNIPREQQTNNHVRSVSSSGSSRARRTASSTSSMSSSTPISPTNHASLTRASIPSSPLISSGSLSGIPRRRSKGSIITGLASSSADQTLDFREVDHGSPTKSKPHAKSLPSVHTPLPNTRSRAFTMGAQPRPEVPFNWSSSKRISRVFEPETPSSSSDNESSSGAKALQRVQRRRQRSKRLSSVSISQALEGVRSNRPLDVLICEDNPVSRRVLEAMLSKLKCRVVSVVDGAQAVASATGDVVFDIIFTDIKVPRLSGVEVARLIRSSSGSNAETPIVAMSSYSTADFQEMAQFFEKRLEKPLTIAAISETIMDLLTDWEPPAPSVKANTAANPASHV